MKPIRTSDEPRRYAVTLTFAIRDIPADGPVREIEAAMTTVLTVRATGRREAVQVARAYVDRGFVAAGMQFPGFPLSVMQVVDVENSESWHDRMQQAHAFAQEIGRRSGTDFPVRVDSSQEGPTVGFGTSDHCLVTTFEVDRVNVHVHRHVFRGRRHESQEVLVEKDFDYPIGERLYDEIERHARMIARDRWGDE